MAETWVLNATITLPSSALTGTFTSTGASYNRIANADPQLYYIGSSTKSVYITTSGWIHDTYRTLVFDTAPTGTMLTWLQANGVKQGGSDPEPETPANVCLVDGTVYGITTGQTLVNGTAQTIYNGRTLVGGTGYDIVLSQSGFTVTITGNGSSQTAWVVINGAIYTSPTTLIGELGTSISLRTSGNTANAMRQTRITIDGKTVAMGTTSTAASYSYLLTGNITIELQIGIGFLQYGTITVTTT